MFSWSIAGVKNWNDVPFRIIFVCLSRLMIMQVYDAQTYIKPNVPWFCQSVVKWLYATLNNFCSPFSWFYILDCICFMHKNILDPQNESNHTIVSLYVNEKGFKIIERFWSFKSNFRKILLTICYVIVHDYSLFAIFSLHLKGE